MIGFTGLIQLLRAADRLLTLESKHGKAIEAIEVKLNALDGRVTRLEAREEIVVAEAKAAADTAASHVAIMTISDMARRIGTLEERSSRPAWLK